MNTTIKSSLFYLLTCSILLISVNIFAQVTQERAEYKGSLVVPNSIIVHVDEAKTKSVTQLTAKLDRVKANFKIETNKYLKVGHNSHLIGRRTLCVASKTNSINRNGKA